MSSTFVLDPLIAGDRAAAAPAAARPATAPGASMAPPAASQQCVRYPCQVLEVADLWFAEHTAEVERAKALCRRCPIRDACLTGAVERSEPWGVWGGEVFLDGVVMARKRGRGRPRKDEAAPAIARGRSAA